MATKNEIALKYANRIKGALDKTTTKEICHEVEQLKYETNNRMVSVEDKLEILEQTYKLVSNEEVPHKILLQESANENYLNVLLLAINKLRGEKNK